ncbi:MAG: mucoidy inhibitor MuiA family protein [Hyphomicrobium sp.]
MLAVYSSGAAAADVTATSKVEAVTVFLSGAEVTRGAKINIDKGDHVVTIPDVPARAVPGSIRVEGKATGKLEIVSVDTRRTFIARANAAEADSERIKIENDIERLRDEKSAIEAQIAAADTQKALIANLAQLPTRPAPNASAGSVLGEDWQRVLALIGQGTADASRIQIEAHAKIRDLDRRIEDLDNKLSGIAPAKSEQTEIKVFVTAATPLDADLIIRYQVADAGWTPLYDARLSTGSKTAAPKLELSRRASISQRTGEDWDNAAVLLSTARPSSDAAAPDLLPQLVDYEPELRPAPVASVAKAKRAVKMDDGMASEDVREEADAIGQLAAGAPPAAEPVDIETRTAAVTVAPFEATFTVPGRVNVPTTGEAKRVVLATEQVEPSLFCKTVPKLDPKAYLYAKLSIAKGTPLLPGQIYLFRDGTFVGIGAVPLLAPGESHDLGFGLDDQVKVRHAIVEEKQGETGLISSSRTDARHYRVTVKNMHERPIQLVLVDQTPVSQQQDIKVEYVGAVQPTKTNVDNKRGVMTYEAKLEADEEKLFDYGYRIVWPAAKNITIGR